jgi:hypothetical protein
VTPLDIDREIGKRFGFTGRTEWIVTDDNGQSMVAGTSPRGPWYSHRELQEWLSEQQKEGRFLNHRIEPLETYAQFSSDIAAAFRVVEAARQRAWMIHIIAKSDGFLLKLTDSFGIVYTSDDCKPDLLPVAICRLALRISEAGL